MENELVEIRYTSDKGRGLFSLVDFKKGDIIFEEEPVVSCQFAWNEDCGYRACDHCLRPLETAQENARRLAMNENIIIPYPEQCLVDKTEHVSCPSCTVSYCSVKCKELAWNKYHRTLCQQNLVKDNSHPLEILKQLWKAGQLMYAAFKLEPVVDQECQIVMQLLKNSQSLTFQLMVPQPLEMHYPPETSNIMLLARIFSIVHQSDEKTKISNIFEQFCHPSVTEEHFAYNILHLKFSNQLDILREQLINSVPTETVPQWITPDGFKSLVILVGMNGQGIGTSAVSDWITNINKMDLDPPAKELTDLFIDKLYEDFDEGVGEFLNNEGVGLYSIQSSMNHSCVPNAEIMFPNSNYRLAVRCTKDIAAGEEICISYVDECVLSKNRHSRQKILKMNYFFCCKCEKCEDEVEQPDETSDDSEESEEEPE